MGVCYSYADAYAEDPTLATRQKLLEEIHIFSSDVTKFYALSRKIKRSNKLTEKISSNSPLTIKALIEYIDIDAFKFLYVCLAVFKLNKVALNGIFDDITEFCLSLWNFCTLDKDDIGNLF